MKFIQNHTVFLLVLFFLHNIKADLRKCAEFDPPKNLDDFPHQNELERLVNSFNDSGIVQTEQIVELLRSIETDEINKISFLSSSKLVQHVVSLNTKKC